MVMYVHINVHINVCMYACMYVCMYVCMYACMHVCMYACIHKYNVLDNCVCSPWDFQLGPSQAIRDGLAATVAHCSRPQQGKDSHAKVVWVKLFLQDNRSASQL